MTPTWERAARAGDLKTLDRQVADGTGIDARDRYGQTALMIAATRGDAATVAWLVERGARLDHAAKYGLSATMLAVVNGHHDVVRILVEAGADLTLQGSGAPGFAGLTARGIASERGDEAMLRLLRAGEVI